MEQITKYLQERIIHLKSKEVDYFNRQYEVSQPLRGVMREFSNECCAQRQELEQMARDLNIKLNIS